MWLQVPVDDTDERKHHGVLNYCVQQHGHWCLIFIRQNLCVCVCVRAYVWIYIHTQKAVCVCVYIYTYIYMSFVFFSFVCVAGSRLK